MNVTASLASLSRLVYGSYAWLILAASVAPVMVLVAFTRDHRLCRRIARLGARAFFAAIGSPVQVRGHVRAAEQPAVVVANHGSYLDGIILTAALPPEFSFLIKREMQALPLAGLLLRRLGSHFVDRTNGRDRNRAARRLFEAAHGGAALAFFPEGTFDGERGLKPFQPGAFVAAWRARRPIVPVVIHGARNKLGAGQWLAAPGPLSVHICPCIDPRAHASAHDLLKATRQAILEHLQEPDLEARHAALAYTPARAAPHIAE